MRAVVTRVKSASVEIDNVKKGEIAKGYLVLLGIAEGDTEREAERLAEKICNLRVFEDENGKMNLSLDEVSGELLIISQFTLYADLKGRRPSFSKAMKAKEAESLYEIFIDRCRAKGFNAKAGEFGADMQVFSINDGPVTLIYDTNEV